MLRRAGLAHRQHLEQVPSGISVWNTSRLSFSPRRPSISVRCLPSTALATRPSPIRSSSSGTHISDSISSTVVEHSRDMPKQVSRSTNSSQTPSVNILFALLSQRLSEDDLRKEITANPSLTEHLLDNTKARQLAEMIALTPDFHLAAKVLQLAHVLGCPLKQNAYECTVHHLATKLRWAAVLSVVSLGIRHTRRTTTRLMNWRIRALVETGQHEVLRSILEEFERFRVKPTRRTFHLLISGHIRNRDLLGARKLLRLMGQIGLPPDDSTHAIIATNYRNLGPNARIQDQALQSLMLLEHDTAVSVLNRLIQLRLDAHDPAATLQMLSVFDPKQVASIIKVVFGVVSTPGGGNPSAEPLEQIYQEYHLSANADTFATFLHYMASRQDLTGALVILEGLLLANIPPTPEIITALVHVYFSTGHDRAAFRTVLDICQRRPEKAFKSLLRQGIYDPTTPLPFVPTNIVPTPRMFNALLKGSLSAHGFACVRDIFPIMEANKIRPNESTVEVLIASAGKSQTLRPRTLLRLLNIPDLQPTLRHLHVLLSSILRHERYLTFGAGWNTTAALFSRTRQAKPRLRPRKLSHADSFDPIAGIYLQNIDRRAAQPLLDRLSARKTNVDAVLGGLRLKREAGINVDMDAAQDVFDLILSRGIQPNEYHFSALMEGYTRRGDLPAALDVLKAATRVGIKPNCVMYTILIVGYARQGQPDQAVTTFKQMIEANVQPDVASIDAVVGAFFAVGAYSMARRSLITLWTYVQPFPDELESAPLKELAMRFRLLHKDGQSVSNLTQSEWKKLYRQLRQLIVVWNSVNSLHSIQNFPIDKQ
ncbi:hypothetical protein J3R30DRAFT_3445552 [Lentinula aciculospora]|uniref:Pentatricopeptide repeat-containing protein-mitochondrial domain-containing protein n=1 Tax=Lentinula aciculospora TaxID=153920 RepID=A0A9W9AMP8_9AGAR|nr:hypothetical protein J3R30DRAFT_3445552 [Lentinula aciculospora]